MTHGCLCTVYEDVYAMGMFLLWYSQETLVKHVVPLHLKRPLHNYFLQPEAIFLVMCDNEALSTTRWQYQSQVQAVAFLTIMIFLPRAE